MPTSDSYLGGVLVGDSFDGGDEPADWLTVVRARATASGGLRLSVALSTQVHSFASIYAYLTPLDSAVVHAHAAITARITELLGPSVAVAGQARVVAALREVLGQRAVVRGKATATAALGLIPPLPTAIVAARAHVAADLFNLPATRLQASILAASFASADLTVGMIDLPHALVTAAARVHAGLTTVRHRSLVLFVTAGRSVDNTLEMELDVRVGSDTRQYEEPEPTREATATYA